MKNYQPRKGDLPRAELLIQAQAALDHLATRPGNKADVHFKYTCENCGERCMLSEPNMLRERGTCYRCGHETEIERGGFTVIIDVYAKRGDPA